MRRIAALVVLSASLVVVGAVPAAAAANGLRADIDGRKWCTAGNSLKC